MKSYSAIARGLRARSSLLLALLLLNACPHLAAQEKRLWSSAFARPGINGPFIYDNASGNIESFAVVGDEVYAGGSFEAQGDNKIIRGLGIWNAKTLRWKPVTLGGALTVLATDGAAVYFGGRDFLVAGEKISGIVKLDHATQTWSKLGSGITGYVRDIAVRNGEVFIAGSFKIAGGTSAGIAKWDGHTWKVLGTGGETRASLVAVHQGNIFAVGELDSSNITKVFKWSGGKWASLGSVFMDNTTLGSIYAFAADDRGLYLGGRFNRVENVVATSLAKWDGVSWSPWAELKASSLPEVRALAVSKRGDIYVGGSFSHINETAAANIAKWDGSNWLALGSGVNNSVSALAIGTGKLYVGGSFNYAGESVSWNFAIWNVSTNKWSAAQGANNNGVYGHVYAMVADPQNVYLCGDFQALGKFKVRNLARWDRNDWQPLGEGVEGYVTDLALTEKGILYAGGDFTSAGKIKAKNIAQWDGTKWSALGAGIDGEVRALAASGKRLCVLTTEAIFVWEENKWSTIDLGNAASQILAFAAQGASLFVGGLFSEIGNPGKPIAHFAKWEGGQWSEVGGAFNGRVNHIATQGNRIYVGGEFNQIGENRIDKLAHWDGKSWSVLGDFIGADKLILALHAHPSGLYTAFRYTYYPRRTHEFYLKRWDGSSWSDHLGMIEGLQDELSTVLPAYPMGLAIGANELIVAGQFRYASTGSEEWLAYNMAIRYIDTSSQNHAPLWSPLPNLTFREDGRNRLELPKYVSDFDDSLTALSFKAEVLGKQGTGGKWQKTSALQVIINPATKIANFKASPDSFGVFKVALMVADPGGLADTTTMHVRVNPRNDAPVIANLPATLTFRNTAAKRLPMWDFVSDVDDADSTLHFSFAASNDSLKRAFNAKTGVLTLTAPGFIGKAKLFITVRDDSNATARDTIAVHVDNTTDVAESNSEIPTEFVLLQNYPNPFNPTTLIRFGLPQASEVKLEIFDLSGQRVATLLNERRAAGFHAVAFNAAGLSSGTYFYRLTAGSFGERKKLLLVK